MNITDKVTKDAIIDYIEDADGRELYKMLEFLNSRQTNPEKFIQYTFVRNGVGFNFNDAELLSGICETASHSRSLTPRQADVVRRRIEKYWRQLLDYLTQVPAQVEY